MKDRISIEGRDGTFNAYIVRPKTLPASTVVVLQELFGVNADIRKTCDELAEQGFVAVAATSTPPSLIMALTPKRIWARSTIFVRHPDETENGTRAFAWQAAPGLHPVSTPNQGQNEWVKHFGRRPPEL